MANKIIAYTKTIQNPGNTESFTVSVSVDKDEDIKDAGKRIKELVNKLFEKPAATPVNDERGH